MIALALTLGTLEWSRVTGLPPRAGALLLFVALARWLWRRWTRQAARRALFKFRARVDRFTEKELLTVGLEVLRRYHQGFDAHNLQAAGLREIEVEVRSAYSTLVEAWGRSGRPEELPPDEDVVLYARRVVAQRWPRRRTRGFPFRVRSNERGQQHRVRQHEGPFAEREHGLGPLRNRPGRCRRERGLERR